MLRIVLFSGLAMGVAGTAALALSFAHSGGFSPVEDLAPAAGFTPVQGEDVMPVAYTAPDTSPSVTQEPSRPASSAPLDHFVIGEAPEPAPPAEPALSPARAEGQQTGASQPDTIAVTEVGDAGFSPSGQGFGQDFGGASFAMPLTAIASEPARDIPAPRPPEISFQPKDFTPMSTGVFR